jgi:hypothetical protein
MHARLIAIACGCAVAIGASAFLLVGRPAADDPAHSISVVDLATGGLRAQASAEEPRPGPLPDARLCLIDTVSCLELAPEPFAPCLLAVERCSGEWRLHPLGGPNTGMTR